MTADLCVMCDFCPHHKGEDNVVEKGGLVTITFNDTLVRTCGAGNTSNPDARCQNGKFRPRNTVIVYKATDPQLVSK